jgi:hypothetical protein
VGVLARNAISCQKSITSIVRRGRHADGDGKIAHVPDPHLFVLLIRLAHQREGIECYGR